MVSDEEAKELLNDPILQEIDETIAKSIGCGIYDHPLFPGITARDINNSFVSIEKIMHYFISHRSAIIRIGVKLFPADAPPKNIAKGACITYCIYLIYMLEMPDKFLDYLNRKRIPKARKVMNKLLSIKEEVMNEN